jgi:hypothetical protein
MKKKSLNHELYILAILGIIAITLIAFYAPQASMINARFRYASQYLQTTEEVQTNWVFLNPPETIGPTDLIGSTIVCDDSGDAREVTGSRLTIKGNGYEDIVEKKEANVFSENGKRCLNVGPSISSSHEGELTANVEIFYKERTTADSNTIHFISDNSPPEISIVEGNYIKITATDMSEVELKCTHIPEEGSNQLIDVHPGITKTDSETLFFAPKTEFTACAVTDGFNPSEYFSLGTPMEEIEERESSKSTGGQTISGEIPECDLLGAEMDNIIIPFLVDANSNKYPGQDPKNKLDRALKYLGEGFKIISDNNKKHGYCKLVIGDTSKIQYMPVPIKVNELIPPFAVATNKLTGNKFIGIPELKETSTLGHMDKFIQIIVKDIYKGFFDDQRFTLLVTDWTAQYPLNNPDPGYDVIGGGMILGDDKEKAGYLFLNLYMLSEDFGNKEFEKFLPKVAAHELMHAHGIGHVDIKGNVMTSGMEIGNETQRHQSCFYTINKWGTKQPLITNPGVLPVYDNVDDIVCKNNMINEEIEQCEFERHRYLVGDELRCADCSKIVDGIPQVGELLCNTEKCTCYEKGSGGTGGSPGEPGTIPCEQTYPACSGGCPPEKPVCQSNKYAGECVCVGATPCVDCDPPECDGKCPPETPICYLVEGGVGYADSCMCVGNEDCGNNVIETEKGEDCDPPTNDYRIASTAHCYLKGKHVSDTYYWCRCSNTCELKCYWDPPCPGEIIS